MNSQWIYGESGEYPKTDQYHTYRLVFHENMRSNYPEASSSKWAYAKYEANIDWSIDSLSNVVNTVIEQGPQFTNPTTTNNKDDNIYTIQRITGTEYSTKYGTKLWLKDISKNTETQYRYALINTGKYNNIYVSDIIVRGDKNDIEGDSHYEKLLKSLNGATKCYVTTELYSKQYGSSAINYDQYEISKTATDFVNQYKLDKNGNPIWGESARGVVNGGIGSALNVYDNILEFTQYSTKKIYVKHIDIGTGNVITSELVNNGTRITPTADEKYIMVGNTKTTSNITETGYEETYEVISFEDAITKQALQNKFNSDGYELRCLGYNIGKASTLNAAQLNVNGLSSAGQYTTGTTATIDGTSIEENDAAIVIEFYYTSTAKEVHVNHIDIDTGKIIKQEEKQVFPRNATIVKNALNLDNMECLGYNMGIGTDYGEAKASIDYNYSQGNYVEGKTVGIIAGAINEEYTVIVIEFYYKNTARQVYVKHVNIGTGIDISTEAVNRGTRVTPTTAEKYITVGSTKVNVTGTVNGYEEYYNGVKRSETITKNALDASTRGLEYIGYNVGTGKDLNSAQANANLKTNRGTYVSSTTAQVQAGTANDEVVVIEFYYYYYYKGTLPTPTPDTSGQEPDKNIAGKLFITANITGNCDDTQQYTITSTPSGSNATVGIEGIPQYMAGAINLNEENNEHKLNVGITLSVGPYTTHIEYGLRYDITYYNITNMLVYKYIGNEIYDAGKGYDGTVGNSIFNWANGKLNDSTLVKNPTIKLYGINNKEIANSATELEKESNYVKVTLNTSLGNYDVTSKNLQSIVKTYVSLGDWIKVDINSDNYINYKDKEVAAQQVSDAKTKYGEQSNEYKTAKTAQDELLKRYDEYLALYNQYIRLVSLSKYELAKELGMSVDIQVRSTSATVDGYALYDTTNTISKNIPFTSYSNLSQKHSVTTSKPTINKNKYNNLTKTITKTEYTNSSKIDEEVLNGVRALAGKAQYRAQVVIGSGSTVKDTAYYQDKYFTVSSGKEITKTYKVNTTATTSTQKYEQVQPINVYTPITVNSTVITDNSELIDQTTGGFTTPLIQINSPFTVKITNNKGEGVYGFSNTKKYNLGYYIKFDFDVYKVTIGNKTYKNGQRIPAGTWIGILTGSDVELTAQVYGNIETDVLNVFLNEKGTYTVRAIAYNATSVMRNTAKLYPTIDDLFDGMHSTVENICTNPNDLPSYFAEATNEVLIINRMYGFRITDVKDLEWKDIFRTASGSSVNKHTGNLYYSGTTKWDTSSTSVVNKIVNRTASEIGRSPLRILPLGPYKNTDITEISAPKLGYRFSYDFKVTGSYYNSANTPRTDKYASINTKFYYISKDGKTFIEESSGGAGIYLFYKNSDGKYVRIDNNGGNYELKFTPNDGYRYTEDTITSTLSKTSVSIGNLRTLTLRYNMATPTDNKAAITYYGEYKLPNSTIVVRVDNSGKYDINNPLTDGYIGVIFDISTYAGKVTDNGVDKTIVLRYAQNTENNPNTSQWDFEGFLGFTNYGNAVKTGELSLKLEKGTWQITNSIYNKIKGTVILYDMDERAASDYD